MGKASPRLPQDETACGRLVDRIKPVCRGAHRSSVGAGVKRFGLAGESEDQEFVMQGWTLK